MYFLHILVKVLIASFQTIEQSSPFAKETTLMDLWLNTCLLFNLAAVFEYAALLYKKSNRGGKSGDVLSLEGLESFNAFGKRVDRMFCVGLLVLFSVVSTFFCVAILVHSKVFHSSI